MEVLQVSALGKANQIDSLWWMQVRHESYLYSMLPRSLGHGSFLVLEGGDITRILHSTSPLIPTIGDGRSLSLSKKMQGVKAHEAGKVPSRAQLLQHLSA
jgi:hypothetical protein